MAEQPTASLLNTLREAGLASLPGHWRVRTLGELLSDDRGISVGVMYPGDHDPDGIPLIKAGDLVHNRIDSTPEFRIASGVHREYRRTELAGGEILMTLVGDVGRCAIVPASAKGWNAARAVAVIRLGDPTDADYVRACLLSRQLRHLMDVWSNTTVQQTLNLKEIKQLPIPWPPRKEREAIASIGRSIDDKIDLLRRMNRTLEDACRTLFQALFMDGPRVRAGGDFRGGEQDLASVTVYLNRGLSPSYVEAGGVPVFNQKCVRDHRVDVSKARRHDPSKKSIAGRELQRYDILVNSTGVGTLGRVAQVWSDIGTAVVDSHVTIVRANERVHPLWLGMALIDKESEIEHLGEGTTGQTELSRARLGALRLSVPGREQQDDFAKRIEPMVERMTANETHAATLAETRDTLLPKLLSGSLRIPDPDRSLKEAGV